MAMSKVACPSCGHLNEVFFRFCLRCGHPLPAKDAETSVEEKADASAEPAEDNISVSDAPAGEGGGDPFEEVITSGM